jgi:hypothetical protein
MVGPWARYRVRTPPTPPFQPTEWGSQRNRTHGFHSQTRHGKIMIKALREQPEAPIVDAKSALAETECDMTAAIVWLRGRVGCGPAAKKAGREAAEGLIAVINEEQWPGGRDRHVN